jgi:hypothetical protein
MANSKPPLTKLPFSTISKVIIVLIEATYTAPDKEDYEKFRFRHPPYKKSELLLPHSCYQSTFRRYPHVSQHS